jgi:hypothetical protein
VRSRLYEPAAIEHEDHVRGDDRGQSVRDRDRRPISHQRARAPPDEASPWCQRRRRLVQDEHARS